MHIGQRLKAIAKERKVSTKALAAHCGVTAGAVSNWFATGRITKPNLLKASEMLNVEIGDLISGAIGDRGDAAPVVTQSSLFAAIELIAARLARADDMTREAATPMLTKLGRAPDEAARIAQMLEMLLGAPADAAQQLEPTPALAPATAAPAPDTAPRFLDVAKIAALEKIPRGGAGMLHMTAEQKRRAGFARPQPAKKPGGK